MLHQIANELSEPLVSKNVFAAYLKLHWSSLAGLLSHLLALGFHTFFIRYEQRRLRERLEWLETIQPEYEDDERVNVGRAVGYTFRYIDFIIRKIGFVSDSHIPEKFICLISGLIMYPPVINKNNPKGKPIDLTSYYRIIKSIGRDPLTNLPITLEDLVVDTELDKQISDYIESLRLMFDCLTVVTPQQVIEQEIKFIRNVPTKRLYQLHIERLASDAQTGSTAAQEEHDKLAGLVPLIHKANTL